MRTVIHIFFTILACGFLVSCEEEVSNPEFYDLPVVEAYLYTGRSFEMKVSRQIPFSGEAVFSDDNIDSLEIRITDDSQIHTLAPAGNGLYRDTNLIVDRQSAYGLEFTYNDRSVTASTQIPPKPSGFRTSSTYLEFSGGFLGAMPDPVTLSWDNPDQSYYLVVVENVENDPEPVRDFGDNEEPPSTFFRNEPTQGDSYEINARSFFYLGTHRVVLLHVNPEYALLYEDGDNTSQNLTDPSTSISNGYGIFTGLNSDTLWIEVALD